jgi:hypothetical protein
MSNDNIEQIDFILNESKKLNITDINTVSDLYKNHTEVFFMLTLIWNMMRQNFLL